MTSSDTPADTARTTDARRGTDRAWWHRTPAPVRRGTAAATYLIAAVLLAFAWASASPIGSSPDEEQHLQYAYGVVSTDALPWNMEFYRDSAGRPFTQVSMPVELFDYPSTSCYAGKQGQTGACELTSSVLDSKGRVDDEGMVLGSTHMTTYPVVYYTFAGSVMHVGLAAGLSGPHTLLLTRVASALLSLLLVGLAAFVVGRRLGWRPALVPLLAGCTPMAVYMFASINPNGFEIAAATLLAATVVAVRHDAASGTGPSPRLQALLVASTMALVGSRPLSVAWATALLLVLLFPLPARESPVRRLHALVLVMLAAAVAWGVAWMLWSNAVRESAGLGDEDWDAYPLVLRTLLVVLKFGDLVRQAVGMFGWADTPLPIAAVVAWLVLATVCVVAMRRPRPYRPSTPAHVAVAYLGLTALVVYLQSTVGAFGWQGRYWLPAVVAFLVLLGPSLSRDARGPLITAAAGLLSIQMFALVWQLWRYMYGYETFYNRFESVPWPDPTPGWHPAGGEAAVLFAGALALALVGLLTVHLPRAETSTRPTGAVEPEGS